MWDRRQKVCFVNDLVVNQRIVWGLKNIYFSKKHTYKIRKAFEGNNLYVTSNLLTTFKRKSNRELGCSKETLGRITFHAQPSDSKISDPEKFKKSLAFL
ncbi:hypothetical protein NC651_035903 [Populus alba x Populus x berolinensis]|nr:hypothetical protein NC651_035903 [Populus alba x Populus x berolinensis]